jgi:hypothetical protein
MAMKRLKASKDERSRKVGRCKNDLHRTIDNPEIRKSVGGEDLAQGGVVLNRQLLEKFEANDISVLPTDNLARQLKNKPIWCLIEVQIDPCLVLNG